MPLHGKTYKENRFAFVRTVTATELGTIILCSNICSRDIISKRVPGYPFQYPVGYPVLQIPENPSTSNDVYSPCLSRKWKMGTCSSWKKCTPWFIKSGLVCIFSITFLHVDRFEWKLHHCICHEICFQAFWFAIAYFINILCVAWYNCSYIKCSR